MFRKSTKPFIKECRHHIFDMPPTREKGDFAKSFGVVKISRGATIFALGKDAAASRLRYS